MPTDNFNRLNEPLTSSPKWRSRSSTGLWEVGDNTANQQNFAEVSAALYNNTSFTTADYYVQSDILVPSSPATFDRYGIIGREQDYLSQDVEGYVAVIWPFVNRVLLYKKISGSVILLDFYNITININTTYKLRITFTNNTISISVDATEYISVNDISFQKRGDGGLYNFSAATNIKWDNFELIANNPRGGLSTTEKEYYKLERKQQQEQLRSRMIAQDDDEILALIL